MRGLIDLISEHKLLSIAIVVILVLGGLIAFTLIANQNETVNDSQGQEVIEEEQEISEELTLTEEEWTYINSYSADTNEFISLLRASVWTANQETTSLNFEENKFTEVRAGSEELNKKFVVLALEKTQAVEGGSTLERYIVSALIDEEACFMTLERAVNSQDTSVPASEWTVKSTAFDYSQMYKRSTATTKFEVVGLNEEFKKLINNDDEILTKKVQEYSAQYFPTASSAEWSETATIDWDNHSIATSFMLNNSAKTQLSVTYDLENNKYDIRKVA